MDIESHAGRHLVSRALIELREMLGETQQQFANRLGTAITTIARYETNRPPSGRVLAQLEQIARNEGQGDCADVFRDALEKELAFGAFDSPKNKMRRNPWHLYGRQDLMTAFDEHVSEINREGHTVQRIRMEFDKDDGITYVADVLPPELQQVTENGAIVQRRVPRMRGRPKDTSPFVAKRKIPKKHKIGRRRPALSRPSDD